MDLWSIWRLHLPWVYVQSAIREMYWVYWCSINLWSIGGWSFCQRYMCILLYVKLLGFNSVEWIYGQFGGPGPSAMGICAFCYTWTLLSVKVLHGSMLNWGVHQTWVCVILLCVQLMGCNSVAWIYGQFGGSICHGFKCIMLYVKLIGCHGVAWNYGQFNGVHHSWVYVHSLICETSWVYQCSIDLWWIWCDGSISHGYMCILLYMKLIGCNSFAWIYAQFGGMCPSAMGIYAFCCM